MPVMDRNVSYELPTRLTSREATVPQTHSPNSVNYAGSRGKAHIPAVNIDDEAVSQDMDWGLTSTGSPPHGTEPSRKKRVQVISDLRRTIASRETLVLETAKFPRADESNEIIEAWVEEVIRHWQTLCGSEWLDTDFGEGGRDSFSRTVLDILYRAATKTFHSTLILRRLFQVHASLAEFDLALRALETYIQLASAARDREKQNGAAIGSIENNDVFIRTLSEGVMMASCFGGHQKAEKAKELTDVLERTLMNKNGSKCATAVNGENYSNVVELSPETISLAYRAVGIGLANWSRWTAVTESRLDLQTSAISSLDASLAQELGHDMNPASIFALGLMLAETRDVDGAIDRVRLALSSADVMGEGLLNSDSTAGTNEQDLVPLWHLLALLLSAREEFETASHICEAVLDTVTNNGDAQMVASGERSRDKSPQIHLGEESQHHRTAFENMEVRKKESILELRMTQLSLIDVLQGPEAAVNHAEELLALFGRLFPNTGFPDPQNETGNPSTPPKTSSGSRSFRGSFFGWKKAQKGPEQEPVPSMDGAPSADGLSPYRPANQAVTESPPSERPQTAASKTNSLYRKDSRQSHKLLKRESKAIRNRSLERNYQNEPQSPFRTSKNKEPPTIPHLQFSAADGDEPGKQVLPPVAHNIKHNKQPSPIGHSNQPPQQDIRLPTLVRYSAQARNSTRFSKSHAQKQALGLLTKVWLFVAELYRKACLFEDALGCWNEAKKQAKHFEDLVAKEESSAKAFSDPGWGVARSSDELWGDVLAERGHIFQAQDKPFDAMKQFEESLIYFPHHTRATVALANLLLDIWEQKILPEEPEVRTLTEKLDLSLTSQNLLPSECAQEPAKESPSQKKDSPEYLERLAARERAYGLLSALTKLGTAWDDSEAWCALARAYEHSHQIEKAKEVLWWCIDLEDRRPIRHWWNVGIGGYVL